MLFIYKTNSTRFKFVIFFFGGGGTLLWRHLDFLYVAIRIDFFKALLCLHKK
jgi:hypothetical protein